MVRDRELPLAVRVHALTAVMGGYTLRNRELLLGPSSQRSALITELAAEGDLGWVTEVTDELARTPGRRRALWSLTTGWKRAAGGV